MEVSANCLVKIVSKLNFYGAVNYVYFSYHVICFSTHQVINVFRSEDHFSRAIKGNFVLVSGEDLVGYFAKHRTDGNDSLINRGELENSAACNDKRHFSSVSIFMAITCDVSVSSLFSTVGSSSKLAT